MRQYGEHLPIVVIRPSISKSVYEIHFQYVKLIFDFFVHSHFNTRRSNSSMVQCKFLKKRTKDNGNDNLSINFNIFYRTSMD